MFFSWVTLSRKQIRARRLRICIADEWLQPARYSII